MQKDKLTLENIKYDLQISSRINLSNKTMWRMGYIPSSIMLSAILIFPMKLIWIGMIPLLFTVYHALRLGIEFAECNKRKKESLSSIDRGDISISVEKLSHFSIESRYDPRVGSRHNTRDEYWLYFMSGVSWMIPFGMLYDWSKDYHISTEGMKNIAVAGNEYYFVTLQGNYNISYVYPCDFFELDEKLKKRERD